MTHLIWVMQPLSIHEELVLIFAFPQIHYGCEISRAKNQSIQYATHIESGLWGGGGGGGGHY